LTAIKSAEHEVHKLFRCFQCGHRWVPRNSRIAELPIRCPGCNSRAWRKRTRILLKCSNCEHQWNARVDKPRACPNCFVRLSWG
jgi:DNA-directed RNA polymerase subunit RPC12/RpoP